MTHSLKKIMTRTSAFVLAVALGATSIGTNLLGINTQSGLTDDFSVSAAYGTIAADRVYYDSGTMLLNGYYHAVDESLASVNDEYNVQWQTTNVTSYVTNSDITLPGTTDINDSDTHTMMCWSDYLNDTNVVDYEVCGALWGKEDANHDGAVNAYDKGMIYDYIAKGTTTQYDANTVKIEWEIRAWRAWDGTQYVYPDDLGLITTSAIASEWMNKTVFEVNAPVWESGNTNWSDWRNDPNRNNSRRGDFHIGDGSLDSLWALIRTLPYGDTNFVSSGKGGMAVSGPYTYSYPAETVYTEVNVSSYPNSSNLLIYEHACADLAAGNRCSHVYTDFVSTDPGTGVTTYPVYSVASMLNYLWRETKVGLYNDELDTAHGGSGREITSYRLYNMEIVTYVDEANSANNDAHAACAYKIDGTAIPHYNVTFKGDNGTTPIGTIVNAITSSNIYDAYKSTANADGAYERSDSATAVTTDVGNTRNEFLYGAGIDFDISFDYQRSGGKIEALIPITSVQIDTVATDILTGEHIGATAGTGITDHVTIVMTGETTERKVVVKGQLYEIDNQGNANILNGLSAEKELTFDIGTTQKSFDMDFFFTPTDYAGKTVVVYENVYDKATGLLLASHEDPTDEDQIVRYPVITTSAVDAGSNSHSGVPSDTTVIKDTVTYTNLVPNKTYVLKGSLHKKSSGVDAGTILTTAVSEVEFTPTTSNGTQVVTLTFDSASLVSGSDVVDIVVYESLYLKSSGQLITSHSDITDANQTVSYEAYPISIDTVATNPDNADSHIGTVTSYAHITDTVTLNNIIDNKKYTIAGQLYVVDANGNATPLLINGVPVKSTVIRNAGSTATHKSGVEVVVNFSFDASGLGGKTIVVYETVTEDGTGRVATHNDPTDADQTIYYPGIDTVAVDSITGTHTGTATDSVVIKDTVTLTNLTVGTTYTLEGTLKYVNASNASGNVNNVSVKRQFTANSANETVVMEIPFNALNYDKCNIIVCEALKSASGTVVYVEHADLNDADQTVYYEKNHLIIQIETDAVDGTSNIQSGVCMSNNSIVDTITYTNADTSIYYTAIGELYEIAGEGLAVPVLYNNVPVTSTVTFKPTSDRGIVKVKFNIDTSLFAGKTLVVYESIYEGTDGNSIIFGDPVAVHEDPTDTRQMIFYPSIDTVAVDSTSGTHVGNLNKTSVIKDTVTYENLVPGVKYTLKGSLMTRDASGRIVAVTDAANAAIVVYQDFTPVTADGTLTMNFTLDSTKYEGKDVVVYEQLMIPNSTITYVSHSDISDTDQTVQYKDTKVVIETDAINKRTNSQLGRPVGSDTIVDTITYKNLEVGTEYVAIGTLYSILSNNNVTVLKNGNKPVTAMTTFTPATTDGKVDVTFTFNSGSCSNKTIVVYEQIYLASAVSNGVATGDPVAAHEDPTDTRQQICYATIDTIAADAATGTNTGVTSKDDVIIDRVYYAGLESGKVYEVVGTVVDGRTGMPLTEKVVGIRTNHTLDEFGYVSNKVQFTASSSDGYVDMKFQFDSSAYAGKSVVVFETLYKIDTMGTVEIASHESLSDYSQTINYPSVDTTASASYGQIAAIGPKVEITDAVELKNLVIGDTYTIKGYLVDKDTKKKLDRTDVEFTFTATEENCTKYLEYTVNTSNLAGKTFVAVANLYTNDTLVCEHNNLEDYDQMVYTCSISTIASTMTGGKTLDPVSSESFVDEIAYKNLIAGNKYKLVGTVVDKTSERVLGTATLPFVAANSEGKIKMTFNNVDVKGLNDKNVVVFQTLYAVTAANKEIVIATLANLDDVNETLTVSNPTVSTVLTDKETGLKTVNSDSEITLIDTIKYTGLVPGSYYQAVSTLVDKSTGKPIKDEADNDVIVKGNVFVAQETTAEFTAEFIFRNFDLAGKTIVAFNELYKVDGTKLELVVSEQDLNNAEQTVVFTIDPVITTEATDVDTGSHTLAFTASAKINDRVTYSGLKTGDTYNITATVYDKATNLPAEGIAPVTMQFKADNKKGYVDVVIPVDATKLSGKTLVVFEKITQDGKDIAAHEDITDAAQTVYVNKVETVLTAGNRTSKVISASKRVVVVDVISYEGLTPGQTYQITGHILDRENSTTEDDVTSENGTIGENGEVNIVIDGEEGSVVTNGRKIIATKTISFTPTSSKGTVAIEFTVNTSKLGGHHLVAFETMTDKATGVVVGEHKDITSASQTVTVKSSTTVYTGDVIDD